MNGTRGEYVMIAKYAERAKHYDRMAEMMEKAVYAGEEKLTLEERNLLYTAFYKLMDFHREALRTYASHLPPLPPHLVAMMRSPNEAAMVAICQSVVDLADALFQRRVETVASKVFYLNMKGDHLRYLAEANLKLSPGMDPAEAARGAYEQAQAFDEANAELAALREDSIRMMPLLERNLTKMALS